MYSEPLTAVKASRATRAATEKFIEKPTQYVLINSTKHDILLEWHGECRVIPAYDRYAPIHPRKAAGNPNYADVCHSLYDAETQKYVPGTLVLTDIMRSGQYGSREVIWSAGEAIQEKLGIDPRTGEYTGAYALRGLSILPDSATPEDIAEVLADGRERWRVWELNTAKTIMAEWDAACSARKDKHIPNPPPPGYVEEASALIRAVATETNKTARELLYGQDEAAAPNTAQVMRELTPVTVPPQNKYQMLAEIIEDPALFEMLKAKFSQVIGSANVPDETSDETSTLAPTEPEKPARTRVIQPPKK